MSVWPPSVSAGQVIEIGHHNGLRDNVVRKKTALEGQLFYTPNSIPFADVSGFLDENTTNFVWDRTNNRLGIGTNSPASSLHIADSGDLRPLRIIGANTDIGFRLANTATNGRNWDFLASANGSGLGVGNFSIFDASANSARFSINSNGDVGIGELTPETKLHLGNDNGDDPALTIDESTVTPSNPTAGAKFRLYMKDDKFIIQFNDAGTVRYKYLDLTGTGVTWVHTTSAP